MLKLVPQFRRGAALVAAATLATIVACKKDAATAPADPPTAITIVDTPAQLTGTAGGQLASPITVRVTDADGKPVVGEVIYFNIISGGGSLDVEAATTDASGDASVHYLLGTKAGADTIQAIIGFNLFVNIVVTALPNSVASGSDASEAVPQRFYLWRPATNASIPGQPFKL